ncbi:MAG TPA: hypothetical protein PKV55_09505 [Nitrospira sp.]|nr:hypothetical protein [Nitrospira sp.]HNO34383.1 hypothetical protein [Nitrospira sp.]
MVSPFQSVPRILEVGEQALGEPPQRTFPQPRKRVAVELAKIVVGQMHGQGAVVPVVWTATGVE